MKEDIKKVDLPWREQTCKQSDNFDLCVTRRNCLKARLKKDEKLLQEYDSIFKAQLEAGIIDWFLKMRKISRLLIFYHIMEF